MIAPNERFIVDEKGRKVEVILSYPQYKQMLEQLEELDSIRAFDAAKASGEKAVPFVPK